MGVVVSYWSASRMKRRLTTLQLLIHSPHHGGTQLLCNCSHVRLTMTHHVRLYLTVGMSLCGMTHICCHRNCRFQCGLCNWSWWIWPFLDNGAAQLEGHQRAWTPGLTGWPAGTLVTYRRLCSTAWTSARPLLQSDSQIFVYACVFWGRTLQVLREPIWAARVLILASCCQDVSSFSCLPDGSPPASIWGGAMPPSALPPCTVAITAHQKKHYPNGWRAAISRWSLG